MTLPKIKKGKALDLEITLRLFLESITTELIYKENTKQVEMTKTIKKKISI